MKPNLRIRMRAAWSCLCGRPTMVFMHLDGTVQIIPSGDGMYVVNNVLHLSYPPSSDVASASFPANGEELLVVPVPLWGGRMKKALR